MKYLKTKLFVIALMILTAGSAFASISYDVTVNTSSLSGDTGYIYLQYVTANAASSTATVSGFTTNGTLAATNDTIDVVNGSAVTGVLPGSVTFANTNSVNDYNHAITFGNSFSFDLSFSAPSAGGSASGSSTFSLGLFADAYGNTPSLTDSSAGTLFTVSLVNDGSTRTSVLASEAKVSPVPIPATVWLLGSALTGLVGLKQRILG
jgi:hypothetical protein